MEFNLAEKLAIIKALDEVILADGNVKAGEVRIIDKLTLVLGFPREYIQEARRVDARECMSILKAMPASKKHALTVLLSEVANADGSVDDRELKLITGILEAAGIDSAHH
jgi:uncharacterized tellurite resistance protein B-like protein